MYEGIDYFPWETSRERLHNLFLIFRMLQDGSG
jgi:hypothetical protein